MWRIDAVSLDGEDIVYYIYWDNGSSYGGGYLRRDGKKYGSMTGADYFNTKSEAEEFLRKHIMNYDERIKQVDNDISALQAEKDKLVKEKQDNEITFRVGDWVYRPNASWSPDRLGQLVYNTTGQVGIRTAEQMRSGIMQCAYTWCSVRDPYKITMDEIREMTLYPDGIRKVNKVAIKEVN